MRTWVMALGLTIAASCPAAAAGLRLRALRGPFDAGCASSCAAPVLGDGQGFAEAARPDAITIYDDRPGHTSQYTLAAPSGCAQSAIGSGLLLSSCIDPNDPNETFDARIVDLRTRAVRLIPAVFPGGDYTNSVSGYDAVGNDWVHAVLANGSYGGYQATYVNVRTRATHDGSESTRAYENLDSPRLIQPLCRPIVRPAPDLADPPVVGQFDYRNRTALRVVDRRGGPVTLDRCGQRPERLTRCHIGCQDAQLGGGWATWDDGMRAYAYSLRTRRLWRTPRLRGTYIDPTHTARALYLAVKTGTDYRAWKAYRAPLPQ